MLKHPISRKNYWINLLIILSFIVLYSSKQYLIDENSTYNNFIIVVYNIIFIVFAIYFPIIYIQRVLDFIHTFHEILFPPIVWVLLLLLNTQYLDSYTSNMSVESIVILIFAKHLIKLIAVFYLLITSLFAGITKHNEKSIFILLKSSVNSYLDRCLYVFLSALNLVVIFFSVHLVRHLIIGDKLIALAFFEFSLSPFLFDDPLLSTSFITVWIISSYFILKSIKH